MTNRIIDMTSKKFGRLLVLKRVPNPNKHAKSKEVCWLCLCDCGTKTIKYGYDLRIGHVKSCGCLQQESRCKKGINTKQGNKEYILYKNIKNRCYNKNVPHYHLYGGRGIKMSKSWYNSFEQFYADMGKIPKGMSIERKDNSKGYSKQNCKWATRIEQNNNRRNNIKIQYKGKIYNLPELALLLNIKYATLYRRYKAGVRLDAPVKYGGDHRSEQFKNLKRR